MLVVEESMNEVQWMSLTLVDDRKGIRPKKFFMECIFPPLLFLHCCTFVYEMDMVECC